MSSWDKRNSEKMKPGTKTGHQGAAQDLEPSTRNEDLFHAALSAACGTVSPELDLSADLDASVGRYDDDADHQRTDLRQDGIGASGGSASGSSDQHLRAGPNLSHEPHHLT